MRSRAVRHRSTAPNPVLSVLLRPAAWAYAGVIALRNRHYDRPGRQLHPGLPVISVGNITVGGTGKTPLVIELVRRLAELGRRPAIVTRGYKAAGDQTADEVLEFHAALPDVPVVVNPDRVSGAQTAQSAHGADCVVLDDGFQHRRIARDVDIVLIDALRPGDLHAVLPAGRLREPLRNVWRADVIVLTRANQAAGETVQAIRRHLEALVPGIPILGGLVEPAGVTDQRGKTRGLDVLEGRRVMGLCGIGNPRTFLDLLEQHAGDVTPVVLDDHHRYTAREVAKLSGQAASGRADWVVTTRKDWVKLHTHWPAAGPPLLRLDVRLQLAGDVAALEAALRAVLEKHGGR